MTNFIGIDGSKNGWVAVQQNSENLKQHELKFCKKLVDLITPELKLAIVDMPIGLEEYTQKGGRLVDREARKNLIKRKSSIFNAPCRGVLKAKNYDEANFYSKKNGLGISKQSWNLVSKIKELDKILRTKKRPLIYESHPELCFQKMNGNALKFSKKEPFGQKERMDLLHQSGFSKKFLNKYSKKNKNFQLDDFLDACALSWTAKRVVNKKNINIPEEEIKDNYGIIMQMKI